MTPEKAKENLQRLTEQLQAHVNECRPHETVASRELLLWFIAAVNQGGSLDKALGLTGSRGRPKGTGKHFELACEIFELMMGQGKSWVDIADAKQMDVRNLQRIYDRNSDKVLEFYLGKLSAR